MEFSPLPIAVCITLLLLTLLPQHGDSALHQTRFSPSLLPRKLVLQQQMKSFAGKNTEEMEVLTPSGRTKKNEDRRIENGRGGGKGTWREWVEEESNNRTEYFTMDYVWVKRRRPIHNKQIPNPYVP